MVEIAWQLMMGVGLAASAGLRAFLPLLVVGGAARAELLPLAERFAWMASTPALTVFAVAVLVEIVGDKAPAVDHALDAVGTIARPVAGAIVAAAPLTSLDPLTAVVVGIVLGGTFAGGVHASKSALRVVSTGSTGGLANPLVSLGEDVASLAGTLVSLFVPMLAFAAVVCLLFLFLRSRRRVRAVA